jgi:2,4-dienoyl-CoA reductase-like NADH-dependent reductase (Old Yellow Enzyme family)
MNPHIVFEPLRFRNLTVKNRIFRSNIAGRFDFYNGFGSQARSNFEERFAKGGVGALISSHVPVHIRGSDPSELCDDRLRCVDSLLAKARRENSRVRLGVYSAIKPRRPPKGHPWC